MRSVYILYAFLVPIASRTFFLDQQQQQNPLYPEMYTDPTLFDATLSGALPIGWPDTSMMGNLPDPVAVPSSYPSLLPLLLSLREGKKGRKPTAVDFWKKAADVMEERLAKVSDEEMEAGLEMMRRPRRLKELTDLLMAGFYFLDKQCPSIGEYAPIVSEVIKCMEKETEGSRDSRSKALVKALGQAMTSMIRADAAELLIAEGLIEGSGGMLLPSVKGFVALLKLEAVVLNCIDDVSAEVEGIPIHRAVEFNWE